MAMLKVNSELKPQDIKDHLAYFVEAAKTLHLETKSFSEHKALNKLYDGLVGFQDDILETLMGYTGERIGATVVVDLPDYSKGEPEKLTKQIMDFAYVLYEWAGKKKYCDIENMAQSLSGLAARCTYLLTLK